MKKFYFLILLAISVALFSSCGNDDDGDKNQFLHGTYKMVIYPVSGDLSLDLKTRDFCLPFFRINRFPYKSGYCGSQEWGYDEQPQL